MIAGVFSANPQLMVHVAAYTDNIGRTDNNLALSGKRARALVDKLAGMGVAEDRFTWEGLGEEDPIADNSTLEGRTLNNRIVLSKR